jgi:hypothetical protein
VHQTLHTGSFGAEEYFRTTDHKVEEKTPVKQTQQRILCIDTSDSRRAKLAAALEDSGFDVWTARNVCDAVMMADVLRPSAVLADQSSTLCHENDWDKFKRMFPRVPVLVHSAIPSMAALSTDENDFSVVRSGDLEIVIAILTVVVCPTSWNTSGPSAVHAA